VDSARWGTGGFTRVATLRDTSPKRCASASDRRIAMCTLRTVFGGEAAAVALPLPQQVGAQLLEVEGPKRLELD